MKTLPTDHEFYRRDKTLGQIAYEKYKATFEALYPDMSKGVEWEFLGSSAQYLWEESANETVSQYLKSLLNARNRSSYKI